MADTGRTGRKGGDDALVLALATGLSVPTAARQAGVAVRTAYRRLEDPAFRGRVSQARDELFKGAVGRLLALSCKAIATLAGNLKCKDRAVANRAAVAILQYMAKGIETTELMDRLAALENAKL